MTIRFKTNIDAYKTVVWPVLDYLPAKGDKIEVHPGSARYCETKHIPTQLEVVGITHSIREATVELWYSKQDFELYSLNGHKLL